MIGEVRNVANNRLHLARAVRREAGAEARCHARRTGGDVLRESTVQIR